MTTKEAALRKRKQKLADLIGRDAAPRKRCLKIHDLAERFNVTYQTILIWKKGGKLPPCLPLPGQPRWDFDAVEKWLAEQQTRGAK
jgi:hypothetical protein